MARRTGRILVIAWLGASFLAIPARAGNVWDGGGSNNNWTTGANWNFDNQPPANNGSITIVMAGTVRPSPNVNVPYDIDGLVFNFNATGFNLSGEQLTLRAGGILQGDASPQRIENAIRIATSQTWETLSGPLGIGDGGNNGTVNLGGIVPHTLTVAGSFHTGFNGRIEGFGTLRKVSAGVQSVMSMAGSAANTYVGATIVDRGTLYLSKPDGVVAVPTHLTIGDGLGSASVSLGENNQIVDTANVTINDFGVLHLNGKNETIANVTINSGQVATGSETFIVAGSLMQTSGTYDTRGQQLIAGSIQVGVNGTGSFIQPLTYSSRVTCNGDLRLGSGAAGSGEYILQSGTMNVAGSLVVGSPGTGLFRQSAGAATFATVLNQGAAEFSGGVASAGALDGSGSLSVTGAGSLTVNRIRQAQLIITGTNPRVAIRPSGADAATSRVGALDLGAPTLAAITGNLDLANNDLIVDYVTTTPLPIVRQYIVSGYSGGAWNGAGIITSMGNSSTFALGYAEASDIFLNFPATFSGQQVDETTVLVAFTRYGDTDLNGIVNFDDYARTDNGFNNAGDTWFEGDFDYNGVVNFDDYALIDLAFNTQTGALRSGNLKSVPEPTSLALSALAVAAARRRRKCV